MSDTNEKILKATKTMNSSQLQQQKSTKTGEKTREMLLNKSAFNEGASDALEASKYYELGYQKTYEANKNNFALKTIQQRENRSNNDDFLLEILNQTEGIYSELETLQTQLQIALPMQPQLALKAGSASN